MLLLLLLMISADVFSYASMRDDPLINFDYLNYYRFLIFVTYESHCYNETFEIVV